MQDFQLGSITPSLIPLASKILSSTEEQIWFLSNRFIVNTPIKQCSTFCKKNEFEFYVIFFVLFHLISKHSSL